MAGFHYLACRNSKWSKSFILTEDRWANCVQPTVDNGCLVFSCLKTLQNIKCKTKLIWRAQLVKGPAFICRWCYLHHRKLTGVWAEKLVPASCGYDIWLGRNRSILPTDQMPHRFWCWFVPIRPAAHIRASFLSLGLQDVCDGTIWHNAVCHVGVLALPTC